MWVPRVILTGTFGAILVENLVEEDCSTGVEICVVNLSGFISLRRGQDTLPKSSRIKDLI